MAADLPRKALIADDVSVSHLHTPYGRFILTLTVPPNPSLVAHVIEGMRSRYKRLLNGAFV